MFATSKVGLPVRRQAAHAVDTAMLEHHLGDVARSSAGFPRCSRGSTNDEEKGTLERCRRSGDDPWRSSRSVNFA